MAASKFGLSRTMVKRPALRASSRLREPMQSLFKSFQVDRARNGGVELLPIAAQRLLLSRQDDHRMGFKFADSISRVSSFFVWTE